MPRNQRKPANLTAGFFVSLFKMYIHIVSQGRELRNTENR